MIQPLLDALQPQVGDKFLDLATGPGYLAERAHSLGCSVVAVDLSEEMILSAQRRTGASRIQFRIEDAEELRFDQIAFDVVATNFGMLHFAQPEKTAEAVFEVLKVGGRFAYTVWSQPKESVGLFLILRAIESYGSATVELPSGPPFFRYSEREKGLGLLKSAGFEECKAHLVTLSWKLPDADSLFEAFFRGTARIGDILRSQPEKNREQIRRSVRESVARYPHRGSIELPMKSWVYSGIKPSPKRKRER
jgi:ubiquinone/menaquinone biosynthesis C-methylase UbiE